jgi:hypothetical protein
LLHFSLSLNFCFGLCHDQNVPDSGSRTVFVGAVMSTDAAEQRRYNLLGNGVRARPLAGAGASDVQNLNSVVADKALDQISRTPG